MCLKNNTREKEMPGRLERTKIDHVLKTVKATWCLPMNYQSGEPLRVPKAIQKFATAVD